MVVVPLVSSRICRREDVYGNAITDGMVCAGSWQNEADACDGDSGGPLTCTERDGKYFHIHSAHCIYHFTFEFYK